MTNHWVHVTCTIRRHIIQWWYLYYITNDMMMVQLAVLAGAQDIHPMYTICIGHILMVIVTDDSCPNVPYNMRNIINVTTKGTSTNYWRI